MIFAFAALALLGGATCLPVETEKIHGRDLAVAISEFKALPPDADFGYAPNPGQQRVFRAGDLRRIAAANHIAFEPETNVCFAWPTAVPDGAKVMAAMAKTLGAGKAIIELLEMSRTAAPPGEIVFPANGISAVSSEPVIWHGYVRYAGDHRFAIWARVRLTVHEMRVKANESLRPGEPIGAGQVRLEAYDGPLTREPVAKTPTDVIGMIPRNAIVADSFVLLASIAAPHDVERGDSVQVVVPMMNGRIETQGIAEAGGMRGAVILVRNAKSGKTFRARVEDRGKVVVVPAGMPGLAVEEKKS